MTNIFDYLTWRGDLTIEQDGFNVVDSLILCMLSYVELEDIVPAVGKGDGITIQEASAKFQEKHANETVSAGLLVPSDTIVLLKVLAEKPRYQDMKLFGYINHIDECSEVQFSALSITIKAGLHYVAFRGTDDTLVGWKEDFNMSYITPVPSQREAVAYVETIVKSKMGKWYLGGHSKGGNLAVYAGAFCKKSVKNKVLEIYNNDGPGFTKEIIDTEEYAAIQEKIKTFVPQTSIIGMLLDHEEEYRVVHSKQVGLFQHDPFSWEILGKDFVELEHVTLQSQILDASLKTWIRNLNTYQKEQFIDGLYEIMVGTEAKTLTELSTKKLADKIKAVQNLEPETRKLMYQVISMLLKIMSKNIFYRKTPSQNLLDSTS